MDYSVLYKRIAYSLWAIFTFVCAFFIVYNAQWLFGDDAIVLTHTGWGHFFPLSYTIRPEEGRFFPFSYLMYNILPLFFHGQISATIVYVYQAIWFILFSWMTFYLVKDILQKQSPIWRYGTAFLVTVFMIGRHYPDFVNCFSTSWFYAVLNTTTALSAYLFYCYKKWWYGLFAFFVLVWTTYVGEVSFVVPLAWGVCALPLWKQSTRQEKLFHIALIVNAVVFLVIYFFVVYLKTEVPYDGAHGTNVSFFENAFRILFAQKFLWLVLLIFFVRVWDIVKNKSGYNIYDVFLLAAAAHCLGGFILKLNWVLYYNRAIVISLPSVIVFGEKYTRPYVLNILMCAFAVFYGIKIPNTVSHINRSRLETTAFMNAVVSRQNETGYPIYLYSMEEIDKSFNRELIRWLYHSFEVYYGYVIHNPDVSLKRVSDYEGPGIYLTIDYNNLIVPNSNETITLECDPISFPVNNMEAYITKPSD